MCECNDCRCCDFEEQELTQEEVIETYLEIIEDGGCIKCTLEAIYEYAFDQGQLELARMYKNISEDMIDEILE